ncbi:Cna B-type domain-containing protein, partial [Helcococcus ovis]|uniref:Cna B-type domain-containing protein n=1 Tax=Helcococcus ovis TaxID=72026 RepID=UPI0038BB4BE8
TPWTPMIPPTRNIKVTKDWKLLTAEKPVDKIEVELYKDGVATGKKLELNKNNNWIGEFKNLEVANGLGNINYHKYTVKEVGEKSYAIQ